MAENIPETKIMLPYILTETGGHFYKDIRRLLSFRPAPFPLYLLIAVLNA